MTPEQKRLVRDTWKQVAPVADAAAGMFYHRLFEIDPTTRKLFRATDMVAQRKKLLQTLAFAIASCAMPPRAPSACKACGPLRLRRPFERHGICRGFRRKRISVEFLIDAGLRPLDAAVLHDHRGALLYPCP